MRIPTGNVESRSCLGYKDWKRRFGEGNSPEAQGGVVRCSGVKGGNEP
jgi:hypothetical protein